MIEIKNLNKYYGETAAVRDLSLKLKNGVVYGVLGAAGAGKSTLLSLLSGSVAPSSGEIRINGFDLGQQPKKARECLGYLPANTPLYPSLSPVEHLRFCAEARGISYERSLRLIQQAMELVGLLDVKDRPASLLSMAERRRLSLSMAIVGGGEILLLDDPMIALSPSERAEILEILRMLAPKRTLFLAGEDATELGGLCQHLLFLSEGRLVADVDADDPEANTHLAALSEERARKRTEAASRDRDTVPLRDGEYEIIDTETGREER